MENKKISANDEIYLAQKETNETEEITLASDDTIFEQAIEIANTTETDEKFNFILTYNPNQKEELISAVQKAGAIEVSDNEEKHYLTVQMNMTQLKLIKSLDGVERVKTDEGLNTKLKKKAFSKEKNIKPDKKRVKAAIVAEPTVVMALAVDTSIATIAETPATMSTMTTLISDTSSYCCPSNTNMENAKEISDESYTNGCICCPGAEQWFQFTATRTGRYTICTTGSLDTIGTLYDCCGNQIAEVDDYAPCGKLNFRIIQNLTTGTTYYVKVRICDDTTGSYTLRVTDRIFADYVTINPNAVILEKDVLYELPITPNYTYKGYNGARRILDLSVSITPSNANEQKIWWWESSGILNCSYGWDDDGDRYIHVMATGIGTAKLYAEDWNENGKRDECTVYVGCAPVTGITLDCENKTIRLGDSYDLIATVYPSNALNTTVIWCSSNTSNATVYGGTVTAESVGTATITARTVEGNYLAVCSVTVYTDTRERVKITKDGDYFNVTFEDGKVWKSVGRDLSLEGNTSGNLGYGYAEWDNLHEWEQRFLDNFSHDPSYTDDQLAYIYYFDPLGVEDYMVNIYAPVYNNKTMLERLNFKDSLYNKIFGIITNKFYFNEDGVYHDYQNYIGWDRLNYYSNAEVLFGWHQTPINWSIVVEAGLSTLFDLVIGLVPPISYIQNGVMLYNYAYYGASINDFSTTLLTSYLSLYDANLMIWVISLLSAVGDATFSQFDIPNDMTIDIYNKVESLENYRTVFMIGETEVSMSDVITHC